MKLDNYFDLIKQSSIHSESDDLEILEFCLVKIVDINVKNVVRINETQ